MAIQALSAHYFKRFPNFQSQYACADAPLAALRLIITIPLFKEEAEYILSSLEECTVNAPAEIEVIAIVNQAADRPELKEFHQNQIKALQERQLKNGLPLRVISALDLDPKQAGVGLARKIAMDEALARLAQIGKDGLIVGLDGDCKVSKNYVQELLQAEQSNINAASLHFEHPLAGLEAREQKNIIDYEIWLRYYARALQWSGFPFHYLTIGSSMAVRASAYAKIGGMNRRKAGEDFYFLHKLMPMSNYAELKDLTVFPRARISDRVPFGTGRAMAEIEAGNKDFSLVYNALIFNELKLINQSIYLSLSQLLEIDYWHTFLQQEPKFLKSFEALRQRSSEESFPQNFRYWWDGFKVLKFVHYRAEFYPAESASVAVQSLWGKKLDGLDLLNYLKSD